MIEPLFMRFIIDRVLLNASLEPATHLSRLNLAGGVFLVVILLSNLILILDEATSNLDTEGEQPIQAGWQ